jgi:glyoxylase-like metal-dependent hydrolase (beta-lactamase superfamily II)
MAGLYPRRPVNIGGRVQALPEDGVIPGLTGWRWVHTPGHTPGHVSLFRFSDRLLIAGDAFVTTRQESLLSILTQRQHVSRPPAYFTVDWDAARRSIETLVALQPEVAATGHGIPMSGELLRTQLRMLLADFYETAVPASGRYVQQPAIADANGVISVPPPVPDPFPKYVLAGAATVAVIALAFSLRKKRSYSDYEES